MNSIDLSWTAPTPPNNYTLSSYNLGFKRTSNPAASVFTDITLGPVGTSFSIMDLQASATYAIRISATYIPTFGNNLATSDYVSLSASTATGTLPSITAVSSLVCVTQPPPSVKQLNIEWAPYNPTISGYEFQFYNFFINDQSVRPYSAINGSSAKTDTTFTFTIDSTGAPLLNNASYNLWVQTVWRKTSTGELFYSSAEKTIGTTLAGPPGPSSLTAFNIGSESIDVSWDMIFTNDYPSGDFVNYNVYISETSTFSLANQIGNTLDPNFKLVTSGYLTISPNTPYYIGASTTFSTGESNIVMLTPSPTTTISTKTPDHIYSLTTQQVAADHIKVQWDPYTTNGTGSFKFSFYISTTPTIPTSTTLNSNTKTITEYDFTSLDSNTTYYIWVVASFGTDDSEPVALSAKTLAQN